MKKFVLILLIIFSPQLIIANSNYNPVKLDKINYFEYEGVIIDSIVIDNRNIFDTENPPYNNFIFRLANKLHLKTRQRIIEKEILFTPGNLFNKELAEEITRNLRHRLKLYDSWIELYLLDNKHLKLVVVTVDEWSLRGGFELAREGNENKYRFGLEELNLFGLNKFISFYYINQNQNDNYVEAGYSDLRFMGHPFAFRLNYNSNPREGYKAVSFSKPFYNLKQKMSFVTNFGADKGRYDRYSDNIQIGEYSYKGENYKTRLFYRIGSYHEKFTLGLRYKYHFRSYFDKQQFPDTLTEQYNINIEDSLYHQTGLSFQYSKFSFITPKNIDGIGYSEDYSAGIFIKTIFGRAFKPDFKRYDYNFTSFSVANIYAGNSHYINMNGGYNIWFKENKILRKTIGSLAQFYFQTNDRYTLAMQGYFVSDKNQNNDELLMLGGTSGVRGYDKYYLTGNKKLVINLENRFFNDIKIISAVIGGVIITDFGKIWKSDVNKFIYSYGAGLRIGFEKATQNIVRIDFIRTKSNIWEISIGTGQYFQAGAILFND